MGTESKYCTHPGLAISSGSGLARDGAGAWGVQTVINGPVPGGTR